MRVDVLGGEGELDTDTDPRRKQVRWRWPCLPGKDGLLPPGEGAGGRGPGTDRSPQPPAGSSPGHTWISDSWPPGLGQGMLVLFHTRQSVPLCPYSSGN